VRQTNLALRRAYTRFNKAYFNSTLPEGKHLDIGWVNKRKNAVEAWCYPACRPVIVRLNARYVKTIAQALLALLHEMAHLAVYARKGGPRVKHGLKWQAEMLRLAKAGAFRDIW